MSLLLMMGLLAQQDVSVEHLQGEQAARRAMEILGVPIDGLRVHYQILSSRQYGLTRRHTMRINTAENPGFDRTTIPHEFWHWVQKKGYGSEREWSQAYKTYNRKHSSSLNYDTNPFELEARLMEGLYREYSDASPRELRDMVRRAIPLLREEVWEGKAVEPKHLDWLEERLKPTRMERLGGFAREQAAGLATYAAAYAAKGVVRWIVTGDSEELKQMARPDFWGSAALFGVVSQATQTAVQAAASRIPAAATQALPKVVGRAASAGQGGLYMAAGMAAVQYATTGRISLKDVAISTASYMIAGAAVNLLLDAAMFLLLGSTPVGWVYIVAKLALTLYFGEKLDAWIRSWWGGATERAASWFEGVRPKIARIIGN